MKKIKIKQTIKNKLLFKLLITTTISIILGLLYTAILSKTDREFIKESMDTFFNNLDKLNYLDAFKNCIISNSVFIIIIWFLGISIIGIPVIIIILILKSFILGFTISSILYFYKFKGIIIAILYIIRLIINLFITIYLSYYGIKFSKNLIGLLFFKKNISSNNIMKKYIKILLISFIIILISSIIEIYIIPSLLNFLQI